MPLFTSCLEEVFSDTGLPASGILEPGQPRSNSPRTLDQPPLSST